MAESKKRIIVDGVEFTQVFRFPKILGAVTASFQPARLAIGLLTVAALITFGRVWDGVTTPTVHPDGLAVADAEESPFSREAYQPVLLRAMREYAPEDPATHNATALELDSRTVLKRIAAGHVQQRANVPADRVEDLDRAYVNTVADIERIRPKGAFEATTAFVESCFTRSLRGAFELRPLAMIDASLDLMSLPVRLWQSQKTFSIVYGLFFLLMYAVSGGAISRMAAVQTASGERLPIRHAVDYSLSRWATLTWAQILPLFLVAILAIVLGIIGLLMAAPVIDLIGALAYGPAILLGFLVALLLLGYALGYPLIVPSVACESSDGADAVQRSYSYVLGQPLRLIGYWIIAKIGFFLGLVLALLFAWLSLNITAELFGWFTNNPALKVAGGYEFIDLSHVRTAVITSWHSSWAATIIAFWQTVVVSLVVAYVFVFHFSASTVVYLLMREACDGQPMDDIWRAEEQLLADEQIPASENAEDRSTSDVLDEDQG